MFYMNILSRWFEKKESKPVEPEKPSELVSQLVLKEREDVRKAFGYRDLPPEASQLKLRAVLEESYPSMLDALQQFGISLEGIPSSVEVNNELTRDVLEMALKLENPAVLIVPPLTAEQMIQLMNARAGKSKHKDAVELGIRIRKLLTNTNIGDAKVWSVGIVEAEDTSREKIKREGDRYYEQAKKEFDEYKQSAQFKKDFEEAKERYTVYVSVDEFAKDEFNFRWMRGWNNHNEAAIAFSRYKALHVPVLTGSRPYLALVMRSMILGESLDSEAMTLLSGFSEFDNSYLVGYYRDGHVVLDGIDWGDRHLMHARGLIPLLEKRK